MSISQANQLFRQGQFKEALKLYRQIPNTHPLFNQIQFNIKMAEQKLSQPSSVPFSSIGTNPQINSSTPLVSVVMPVFNVASYLDASIMSVLNQSYANIELIIVNDASTDNGMNIIKMYEQWDDRIKVIDLEFNTMGGAGIPSNVGVGKARGKYVAYADSDDILDKNAIANMVNCAETHNAEVVVADFANFNNETRIIESSYDKNNWANIPINQVFNPKDTPSILRLSPVPWRKLYHREFLKKNGIWFPEGDYFYEDNPLHWFVLSSAQRVVLLDYVVAYHRMEREGQTMGAGAYKLTAQFCHLNSIKKDLQSKANVPSILWKELVDFAYRGHWVVDKQENAKIAQIVKKRYAQTALSIAELSKLDKKEIEKMRPAFYKRCNEYHTNYKNKDLAIVIPVYNCVDLLPELLKDVVKSKLKTEIFLIDDGSTDGSQLVCQEYEQKYNNVVFISQANKGAGVARNAIIPLISAQYTYFVDADDLIDITALDNAVIQAKNNTNDLIFFPYKIHFYEKNTFRGMWDADQKVWNQMLVANSNADKKALASQLVNYPWNRVIKTELLHDEKIFFGKTVVHNDVPYHWHSIISAQNIGLFEKPVCSHRKFTEREQITNISDNRRLAVLEAYRHTHNLLKGYKDYNLLFNHWQKFIRDLLTWARDRVPEDKLEFYKARHKEIVDNLKLEMIT